MPLSITLERDDGRRTKEFTFYGTHRNRKVQWWLAEAGSGGDGEMLVRGNKLSVIRGISSRHLWYSMVTKINKYHIISTCYMSIISEHEPITL